MTEEISSTHELVRQAKRELCQADRVRANHKQKVLAQRKGLAVEPVRLVSNVRHVLENRVGVSQAGCAANRLQVAVLNVVPANMVIGLIQSQAGRVGVVLSEAGAGDTIVSPAP